MYTALYRKWRPKSFEDVIGQHHITETLKNELITGKLSHAYLFIGSRGTGKTTCAKILAKAVNCPHSHNGDPCNECEICKGIDDGSILDVEEIDAASNNSVDDIRNLRDEVQFSPNTAKYRVYIIDEVHMLSTGAFNALLKTLEEPPAHVKFILATTEVHKMPATILSRCQRFDFKRISPEAISERLLYIAEQENMKLSDDAAMLIARLADGAMRDALSILDQCFSRTDEINSEVVRDAVGLADKSYFFEAAEYILDKNSASLLSLVSELHGKSCDMEIFCSELINYFRNIMVAQAVRNVNGLIICSDDELEQINYLAKSFTRPQIISIITELQNALTTIKSGADSRLTMEMILIKLSSPEMDSASDALLKRIAALERAVKSGVQIKAETPEKPVIKDNKLENPESVPIPESIKISPRVEEKAEEIQAREPKINEAQPDNAGVSDIEEWPDVINELFRVNPGIATFCVGSTAKKAGSVIIINPANEALHDFLQMVDNSNSIISCASDMLGESFTRVICEGDEIDMVDKLDDKSDPLSGFIDRAIDYGVKINFI